LNIQHINYYSDQLRKGATLLYPTDTIWGLGCDAFNQNAVQRIYEIKNRDRDKPCILLVDNISNLKMWVKHIHPRVENLIHYYKKPITIIYEASHLLPSYLTSENNTVAIRVANDPFCKTLIQQLNKPIISTSANIQSEPFPNSYLEISEIIKSEVDVIVDQSYENKENTSPSVMIRFDEEGELIFLRS